MKQATAVPQSQPRSWRRWLFWGSLTIGFLSFPAFYVVFLLWDGEPPQDDDLMAARAAVAPERNGALHLDAPEAAVDWGKRELFQRCMAFTLDWDPKLADALIAKNSGAIEKFDEALQAPEFHIDTGAGISTDAVMHWRALGDVLTIRAHRWLELGQLRKAMEDGLRQVRFGERVQKGSDVLIYFLVGTALRANGFRALTDVIVRGRPSREESEWLERELAVPFLWRDSLATSLRGEYRYMARQYVEDPTEVDGDFFLIRRSVKEPAISGLLRPLLGTRLFLNPSLTRRLLAESVRDAVAAVLRSDGGLVPQQERLWYGPFPAKNYLGKRRCGMVLGHFQMAIDPAVGIEPQPALLRTLLALRMHQLEKGGLPAKLEDLVPHFVAAVPLDPQGLPVLYDLEARTLTPQGKSTDAAMAAVPIEFDPPLRPSSGFVSEEEEATDEEPARGEE